MERNGTDAAFAAWVDEAQAHVASGNVDEAERLCAKLMTNYADSGRTYYRVGEIYWLQQRWEEAATVLRRGLEVDPQNALLRIALGRILLKTGEPAEAAALLKVFADKDDNVEGLQLLHRCHWYMRDWARVDELGDRLAAILPPSDPLPTHVLICGFSRSGTTLLYNMMRGSAQDAICPSRETSALAFKEIQGNVITKRPLDVFRLGEIKARLKDRVLKVVLVVRDCRSLITSFHSRVPEQEFQGYDHSFFLGHECSFSNPGLIATNAAILQFLRSHPQLCQVVRFEDLVRDPEGVRAQLQSFTGLNFRLPFSNFWKQDVPEPLQTQLNGLRPLEAERASSWVSPRGLKRVARQFALAPELHQLLFDWGYEQDRNWFGAVPEPPVGKMDGLIVGNELLADEIAATAKELGLALELAGSWSGGAGGLGLERIRHFREARRGPMLLIETSARIAKDPWPYLSQYDGDVAVFTTRTGEIRSDVIWLNDTIGAAAFLEVWQRIQLHAQDAGNGALMQQALKKTAETDTQFSVQHLPPSMCQGIEGDLPAPAADSFVVVRPAV